MIIIDKKLQAREKENNPIKVGLIGTGIMGQGILNQIVKYTPGVEVVLVYNRTLAKAEAILEELSIEYTRVDSVSSSASAIKENKLALTSNIDVLVDSGDAELLIEITGTIEFALDTILRAFKKGKHILSFNAELDSTLGYFLKEKAAESGVKYGVADGDQPAVTMNLLRFVKDMGFKPLVCGNIKGLQDRYRTPETQKGFAEKWNMTPEMVTSFADGTKISFEQACIANAANMQVGQRGMYGFSVEGHVDDHIHIFDHKQAEELGGIVDFLIGPKPGPGVFIYAKRPDDRIMEKYMRYMKMGDGPVYSFYTPYHLLFLEIGNSICRMVDFDDCILTADYGIKVEVITAAKTELGAGERIDGLGGFKTYGMCENYSTARRENLLPMGIAEGCTLKNGIGKDAFITLDDVDFPSGSLSVDCYFEQINMLKSL